MPAAIVTGSDSGIGKASAVALAHRGFDVGITWHQDDAGAKETAEEVQAAGRRAEVRRIDLDRLPQAADIVDELAAALGGELRAFVNNAATGVSKPFLELGYDEWRHTLRVDLDAAFLCAQRAARRMVGNGLDAAGVRGRIVNVSSVHEHVPLKGSVAYCASKGGMGLMTKVMALELAEHGILVNTVAPGEISTPMTGQHNVDPHSQDRPRIPLHRPGDAREIADLVAWLCSSPGSAYVTGSSFVADGGLMLMAAVQGDL